MRISPSEQATITFHGEISDEDVKLLKMKMNLWIDRSDDLTPVWEMIREQMHYDVREVFRTEGRSMGEKWVGLAKSTIRDRVRKGYAPAPILYRSGKLINSLLGGAGAIDKINPLYWEYGTEIKYAIYHQSRKPRKKLPRRAFLYISNKLKGKLIQGIHKYIFTGQV